MHPKVFTEILESNGIRFITGVPDSLLKSWTDFLQSRNSSQTEHTILPNEGISIAAAIGHNLGANQVSAVYFQNSGIGNAINPLISFAESSVYSIPILLIIGWRGEIDEEGNQIADEPQHMAQGRITRELLENLGIEFIILRRNDSQIKDKISNLILATQIESRPKALLVSKDFFDKELPVEFVAQNSQDSPCRIEIIRYIIENSPMSARFVSTTGYTSRELMSLTSTSEKNRNKCIFVTGAMGHSLTIASFLARERPKNKIVCMDGDGALQMHYGSILNKHKPSNLVHVLFNNGIHESVGGQPITNTQIDYQKLALMHGYTSSSSCETLDQFEKSFDEFIQKSQSAFIEVKIQKGSIQDLPRPTTPLQIIKENFMRELD